MTVKVSVEVFGDTPISGYPILYDYGFCMHGQHPIDNVQIKP